MIKPVITLICAALVLLPTLGISQQQREAQRTVEAPEYPRVMSSERGTITIHYPQIETWDEFEALTGWVAVEASLAGEDKTWLGSVKLESQTDIDFDERLVVLHDTKVVARKFPEGQPPENVLELVRELVSLKPRSVPLDVVIRALPEDFELPERGVAPELKSEPPQIFASTTPASLMIIHGDPVKVAIEDTRLEFVVNTNWDLFYYTRNKRWYVLNESTWQYTKDLDNPNWKSTTRLPGDFKKIPGNDNWSRVKEHVPAKKSKQQPPKILISKQPAELILITGKPEPEPIEGTDLVYINNTESDLFLHGETFYYLVSGRWFSSTDLQSEWAAVTELPEDFKNIPGDHAKANVLASVPGTHEARAAVIEALIPRTASISVDAGSELEVVYAGEPTFVDVEGTTLQRAANTKSQVIVVSDGQYYVCENAVWFVSDSAEGPWRVATIVPDEIYKIPPSDPAHNVTYVYIMDQTGGDDDDDDDDHHHHSHVTYGYTSGYYDTYVRYGIGVTYGTGWYYSPWVYYPSYGYPHYYWYPPAYGYGAWYNPATGFYGQRAVAYGPYGGAASTAVYNPRTGTYGRGWSAWDGDEVARSGYAYNPRRNTAIGGNSYYDFDDKEGWREGYVQRGDRWVYSEAEIDGNRVRSEFETSRGVTGTSQRTINDDSITGRGQIEKGNRSAQTESRIDRSGAELSVDGDRGGNVDISRDRGQQGRDITGTTAGGTDFEGTTRRTGSGTQTRLETETGGSALVNRQGGNVSGAGRTDSGDLYAGRNGNVYRQGNNGWQHYDGGGWNDVNRPSSTGQTRTLGLPSNSNTSRSGQYSRDVNSLNRQRSARQSGTSNYNRYQSQRSSFQRGSRGGARARGGRRR